MILLPQSPEPWGYKLESLGLAYHDSETQNSHFHLLLTKQCPAGKGRFVTHPTSDVHPGYTESSVKLAGRERGNLADQQAKEKDVTKPVSQAQEPGLCISYQGNGLRAPWDLSA